MAQSHKLKRQYRRNQRSKREKKFEKGKKMGPTRDRTINKGGAKGKREKLVLAGRGRYGEACSCPGRNMLEPPSSSSSSSSLWKLCSRVKYARKGVAIFSPIPRYSLLQYARALYRYHCE